MPDDIPDITTSRRNSEWADLFSGASTNLAQRQRYAQDKAVYANDLLDQQESAALDLARRDKTAQDFYFRQKDLDRRMTLDEVTRGIRHQQESRKDAMLPLQIDTEKARAAASEALAQSRLNKELRDARHAERVTLDTDSFESKADELAQTHAPGSKAFADGLLGIVASHPYVPADLRKAWMAQADIEADPDQLMRDTAKYRDTHNTTLRMNDKGKWSISLAPKTEASSPSKEDAAHLSRLEGLRMKPSLAKAIGEVDKDGVPKTREGQDAMDQIRYLDEQINIVKSRLNVKQPAAPAAAAPGPAAPESQATTKTVWKIGPDGVKWEYDSGTKEPTGRHIKPS